MLSSSSLLGVLVYLWSFLQQQSSQVLLLSSVLWLCAHVSTCLLGFSAQTGHWHLQIFSLKSPKQKPVLPKPILYSFLIFPSLGVILDSFLSLISQYNPPARLLSLIFKYTWTLSTRDPLHFHHPSSRSRAVLEGCSPRGLPAKSTFKRRPQCRHLS